MFNFILYFILLILTLLPCTALAAQAEYIPIATSASEAQSVKNNPTFKEFGILTSYGTAKVTEKDDYVTIPMFFRFGIDCDKFGLGYSDWIERGAKDLFHKDFRPKGTTEFLIEPFLSYVPSPDSNMEGGIILAFKYDWPLTEKFHTYVWNGGGIMYITQHLREQSTQWNFTPQMGGGFSYFLDKNKALSIEYRHRHFSNANKRLPNDGINQGFISVGFSWFY
ncbi:MAG: acyloxyacyl hydrolase [Candidatus Omnitrophica bacterium]|nr:acyloxyacyl hydrolase [Candidatus Omnitrophota bacterium]